MPNVPSRCPWSEWTPHSALPSGASLAPASDFLACIAARPRNNTALRTTLRPWIVPSGAWLAKRRCSRHRNRRIARALSCVFLLFAATALAGIGQIEVVRGAELGKLAAPPTPSKQPQDLVEESRLDAIDPLEQIEREITDIRWLLSEWNDSPKQVDRAALRQRAERISAKLDTPGLGDALEVARLQTTLSNTLHDLGSYACAVAVLEKARATREAKLGIDHPDTLTSRNNLASAYHAAGWLDKALALYEATLKAREAKLGVDHPDTLTSRNNLASAYLTAGQFAKALPLLEASLKAFEAKLGADHPNTLTCRNNLASAYQQAGQIEKALPLFDATLKACETTLGADHPNTITSRNNLAGAYLTAGQFAKALPLFEATLKAQEANLGPDHPRTLATRTNLAWAYQESGQLDKAFSLLEPTLKVKEATLGIDHPDTLTTRANLAGAYFKAGKLDKALPLLEVTLKASEAKLGADHPDTLRNRNNLAVAYQEAGQLDKALPLLEATLKGREATLGADHPLTLTSRHNLARAYQAAKQLDKALPLFEQAAAGMEKQRFQNAVAGHIIAGTIRAYVQANQFDKAEAWLRKWQPNVKQQSDAESLAYAIALDGIGHSQLTRKQWAEAETTLRECLTIRQKLEPDASITFNTMSMLGEALLGQKKYAEAEPLLLKGYEGLKARAATIPANVRPERLREALQRLVQLYDALGKKAEADKWRRELDALK